ncbi:type II toxin-antitoxin system RelE/ParE family toxin [Xanthomonas oryzae pv. oryzae]|uniref:type II toxin-antitoxin system RelE/ParE family toxin n=1 Tax=Xanthomonas oryzae TaxID=347 RepID=UPI000DDE50FF|nr:type II toxin-antitoxin system RelE/ParE family toxin [Xanthomonas oryzae]RBH94046.1 type II toxin-antitoxin system RelE/ParE family toxin [Xanthomonas oryzae pv. oryzae]
MVWSAPTLADLEATADDIAIDNVPAAAALVKRVFAHVEQLIEPPDSGSRLQKLKRSRYRQIVEPPCRVIYRLDGQRIVVVHVLRSERALRKRRISRWKRLTKRRRSRPVGAACAPCCMDNASTPVVNALSTPG